MDPNKYSYSKYFKYSLGGGWVCILALWGPRPKTELKWALAFT